MNDVNDVARCEKDPEGLPFRAALPSGTIDAYFAGHTHAQMRQIIDGVPTMQAAAYSRAFSTLDLWIDTVHHHALADRSVLRPPTMICPSVYAGTESCDSRDAPKGTALVPRVFEGKT